MKIGILTFHCAHNYGAVLQCYALQETLKSLGHKVEIIDYKPNYLVSPYRSFYSKRLRGCNLLERVKAFVKEFLLMPKRIKRYNAFQSFIKNRLNLSRTVKGKDIPLQYDTYIIGSDQIWNPKITNGFDSVFFGNFNFAKNGRTYISYAASMEAKIIDKETEAYYRKALMNFDALSVREIQLKTLLQPLTEKNIELVLDPTLLADKKIWDKIAERPDIDRKYILVYEVRQDSNTERVAQQLAKEIDAEVIKITAGLNLCYSSNIKQCESPEKFIGWIKYADCIITTSFHGTAFSIIFNRPFYCLKLDDGADTRSASLLNSLSLEDRFIDKTSNLTFTSIDFSEANKRLANMQVKSLTFLINALEK